ncbi:hypothetical protein E2C01_004232 [Portunus trituberculatus]|uniref:Uncharacterized protein n=1 Tax=Portunus trituberculatus TaxID=210409 RepID=A0A5B7CQU9_PORTR|nr:hypothetical protein [Portunus trituberculatus]
MDRKENVLRKPHTYSKMEYVYMVFVPAAWPSCYTCHLATLGVMIQSQAKPQKAYVYTTFSSQNKLHFCLKQYL